MKKLHYQLGISGPSLTDIDHPTIDVSFSGRVSSGLVFLARLGFPEVYHSY